MTETNLPEIPELDALGFPKSVRSVIMAVRYLSQTGKTGVYLQLRPERLGRVHVRILLEKAGLHIELQADLAATAKLLHTYVLDLERALSKVGVQVEQLSVSVGDEQDHPYDPSPQLPSDTLSRQAQDAATETMDVAATWISTSLVDLKV